MRRTHHGIAAAAAAAAAGFRGVCQRLAALQVSTPGAATHPRVALSVEKVLTAFGLLFRQKLDEFEADVSELQTQLDKVNMLLLLIQA